MTALAALCFSLTAQAQGPVVVSDKDDYAPGEAALFQATGFQPNELLDFSVAVQDDQGLWVPDIAWADVQADASGSAEVDYVVPQTWADKTLQLTVMGLTSGLMATTTFTDANPAFVQFETQGLPVGTFIGSISGWRWVPSGANYAVFDNDFFGFGSPGPNSTLDVGGCQPNTSFEFHGFPLHIDGGCANEHYDLTGFTQFPVPLAGSTPSPAPTPGHAVGFTFGSGVTTVVTAHYTHVGSCGPANQPPHITCTGNDANLGAVVGCLGTGTGFGQSFPVSYTQSGTNPVTVTATFTLPDSSTLPVTVATISDPDAGDTVIVTLSGGTDPVVISGPGNGSTPFTVHIDAHDNHNLNADNNPQDCGGNANAQITYAFSGFFPPLNGQINTKVKRGSGVPVKFSLADCSGNQITTGDHTISVARLVGITPAGEAVVDDAGMSGDGGDNFRYDPTGMQWIFNLKTNSSYVVGTTYQITATLDDGTTHDVSIAIK